MMNDVANMVNEQGDELDRIEDHVYQAKNNTEKGTKELEKTEKY
jgi:t-SNARE complex subunit (syntaxin)